MSRSRYLIFRSIQTIFMLWLLLTLLFLFFRLMPGSFADQMLRQGANPEAVEQFRERWGLNDPLYIQYFNYIKNFALLDPGNSIKYRDPVWQVAKPKMVNSFILVAPAITLAYVFGSIIGTFMGSDRNSLLEKYGLVPIILFGAVPEFILAIFMLLVFASWLNWFPTSGMIDPIVAADIEGAWWRVYFTRNFLDHYVLPFSTVFLRYLFLPVLIMRTSVVEVMGQEFIRYQEITGLPKLRRLYHIGKHGSLPVLTVFPISMTRAIGGIVLVEMVFNWPGIGFAILEAVFSRDFPFLQFIFFLIGAFIIIANFVVDILYGLIDPRVSVGENKS